MTLSPRAGMFAVPALVVFVGSYLMARPTPDGPTASDRPPDDHRVSVERPTAEHEESLHRVARKQETAADLLDGRLTLAEAVARFREVSTSTPAAIDNLRQNSAGPTDEARLVHQVLSFVRSQVAHRQDADSQAALLRLEAEAQLTLASSSLRVE